MRTIQVNLYQFDELNEDAKEKALEWAREIDHTEFWFNEELKQFCESEWGNTVDVLKKYPKNVPSLPDIGLSADSKKCDYSVCAWSQNHNHITPERITIQNLDKFIEFLGMDKRSWFIKWLLSDCIDISIGDYSKGNMAVNIDICDWPESYGDDPNISDKENQLEKYSKMIEDKINSLLSKYTKSLIKQIEDSYSDESLTEFIEANEYEFLENGKRA